MDFNQFKDIFLAFLLTGMVTYLSYQMRQLVDSVNVLNVRMAEIVAHLENHKEQIEKHDERLDKLENSFTKA